MPTKFLYCCTQCRDTAPKIIAGDDVARYVADPHNRSRYWPVTFDYFSLAGGEAACRDNHVLYSTLKRFLPNDCADGFDLSLDGHAALAYDATWTMVVAVQRLIEEGAPVNRGTLLYGISKISGDRPLQGLTGNIDFGGNRQEPLDKAISILRDAVQGA